MENQSVGRATAVEEVGSLAHALKREFTFGSAFALAFAFISPIIALDAIFALGLGAGGLRFGGAFR